MPVFATHTLDINTLPQEFYIPVYNGLDNCLTYEVNEIMSPLAEGNFIYDFERALQAPVMEMQLRGFRIDPIAREEALKLTKQKLTATLGVLTRLCNYPINPNSGDQLRNLFYNQFGLKPVKRYYKGEVASPMDRKVLESFRHHLYAAPITNAVLLARDLVKIIQVLETDIDLDWRWRCSYNIAGTTTGRFSSSKSGIGTGSNFQNITEDLRRIFIADPGYKLCGIDGEQAEARFVGWFCGITFNDWRYLNAAESGDLHTYVTRLVYPDWPWTGDLSKDRKLAERTFHRHFTFRDASKRLAHGTNYLGQPDNMARQTQIPLPLVRDFYDRYMTAFECIDKMHKFIISQLQTKRRLTSMMGRPRDFFDRPNDPETWRAAVAFMFQSSTSDYINLGLWRIWRYMGLRVQILSQLHDAVYFQFRTDDDERDVVREALDLMQIKLRHNDREFYIPCEAQTGFNWGHKWKLDSKGNKYEANPKGLDKVKWD
jgi:DNA polymerase I-like protein with 3'-5' exonuclease and polymerase domains